MTFKGPKGEAYVYQGNGHDWIMEFWPVWRRKARTAPKTVKRTFTNSAKQAAITVAKQMTGLFG